MTRDEILALKPGPKLDRLVAEFVMGWEHLRVGYFGDNDPKYGETKRQVELTDWLDRVGLHDVGDYFIGVSRNFWVQTYAWTPSKDFSQAWKAVYALRKKNRFIRLSDQEGYFKVSFFHPYMVDKTGFVKAETAQEAICKAGLLVSIDGR